MELLRHLDGYCERTDPGYWAEPVNALTNLSFILVALVMWRRSAGQGSMSRWLVALVFAIGVGSYLFHTHAQVWALIADVTPILAFILLYLFAVNRDVLGLAWYWALAGMLLFLPYAALTVPLWQAVPLYDVSAGYMPVFLAILLYAAFLWGKERAVALGFLIGAGLLLLSLTARSLDERVCAQIPLGTHYWWHVLNGVMLGWMIEVYRRFRNETGRLEARGP